MDQKRNGGCSELLTGQNAKQLVDSVDAFLFDCDGVIWRGDVLIDGVPDTLHMLRSLGKKLVFVTNNSMRSRAQYSEKFHSLGIPVDQDDIFSSSFAVPMFLKLNNFPKHKKVYVIGEQGILDELKLQGFTTLGGPEDAQKTVDLKLQNVPFEHDKDVGAVVVGLDTNINYYKLQYATLCIRENPGCLFIGSCPDPVGHLTPLQEWPADGCLVSAICNSTEREPTVVGKPSTLMMNFVLDKYNISTTRMCMVGDSLATDIPFGQAAGCKTLLVLSGVTKASALENPRNNVIPDYCSSQVADIKKLYAE